MPLSYRLSIGLLVACTFLFLVRSSFKSTPLSFEQMAAQARLQVLKSPDWPVKGCPNRDVECVLPFYHHRRQRLTPIFACRHRVDC